MNFSIDPDKEFAGIRFIWLLAKFGAGIKVTVNRFTERVFQFTDRLAVKTDNIPDADDVPDKNMIFCALLTALWSPAFYSAPLAFPSQPERSVCRVDRGAEPFFGFSGKKTCSDEMEGTKKREVREECSGGT